MHSDQKNTPSETPLDLDDPLVRDFLARDPKLSLAENLRQLRSTIKASESASFLSPRDAATRDAATRDAATTSNEESLPRQLGPYTLRNRIGSGGFSCVYQATREDPEGEFAIKVFNHRWLDAIERLDIERFILQKLDHPNLVSIVDFGQTDDGIAYLVMPMIHGMRIDQYVQQQKVAFPGVARLFSQIASGLQYAHERGIIHRDLKPGNILVSDQGVPIVTDFGLAKHISATREESRSLPSVTITGALLGTLGYLAPEQIAGGEENVTRAVDIYGLGATLYRVLAGQAPNESRNILKALRESHSTRVSFPRDKRRQIPSALRAICLKCLEKSPVDRYGSMREIEEDLGLFAEGLPVRIRRVPWALRMKRWIQAEPLTSALCLALASAIVCGLVLSFWLWRSAERERIAVKEMLVTAREILNDGDRVAERSLDAVPGTLEFRYQRLEKSADFFDRLLARYPTDIELVNDSAVSNFRLASVALHLGRYAIAEEKLSKAEGQFQRLVDAVPQVAAYRFDLFHCCLTRHHIQEGLSHPRAPAPENLLRADKIISGLVEAYPEEKHYLDAQICVRVKLIDVQNIDHEERIRQLYHSAIKLKEKSPTPCLEWRHAGTAARTMTLYYLEQLDRPKVDEWLPVAKKETLEFLQRPSSVLDDRVDWIRYLELACQAASLRGDEKSFHELRRERLNVIEECLAAMPERPAFLVLKENEAGFFDRWLEKTRVKRTANDR
ncbi:MAG: serine/threonine-protein kinase [Planctomycetota bacterium]